ncbi:hypothetical protein HPB52_001005 [Rhipicephalus sanguineus]|uniref:Uncharacterized protein n=1 Tax=Rhipicephalus sanguineus TaxID=34632 RepID=A0A9D4PBI3_RHISA|nr:hypothetical protein HPB52_001005 [Rhipicephalus sanguineus]
MTKEVYLLKLLTNKEHNIKESRPLPEYWGPGEDVEEEDDVCISHLERPEISAGIHLDPGVESDVVRRWGLRDRHPIQERQIVAVQAAKA